MTKQASKIRLNDKLICNQLDLLNKSSTVASKNAIIEELTKLRTVGRKYKKKARSIPYGKNGREDLKDIGILLARLVTKLDRIAVIQIDFTKKSRSLSEIRKLLEGHIRSNYQKEMSGMNVGEKNHFVESILADLDNKIEDLEMMIDISNIAHKNLMNVYYILKEVKEIAILFMPANIVAGSRFV